MCMRRTEPILYIPEYTESGQEIMNMIALEIADLRDFTSKLFLKETFDSFELVEAEFYTDIKVNLDGQLTDPEDGRTFSPWSEVRPLAFQVIKGKKLPHAFHVVLRLSDENMANTLRSAGVSISPSQVAGLYLNIHYERKKLSVVSGCSFRTFIMDKTLEKEWDRILQRFLKHHQIPFQNMV